MQTLLSEFDANVVFSDTDESNDALSHSITSPERKTGAPK